MTSIKNLITAAALALLAAGNAAAIDYGFELSNEAGINYVNSMKWYTDNEADAWMTIPLDATNTNSLSIEGKLYGAKPVASSDYTSYANLELFRLSLVPVSKEGERIAIDAGRITTADITGYILNQAVDGTEIHSSFGFGNIDILAAYTGLLNVRKTGTLMSEDDYVDMDSGKLYAFGSKRIIGKVTVQIPQFYKTIDMVAEGIGQYDLRSQIESDPTQTVHTGYGTLSFSGPVSDKVFFTLSGTFQTGIMKVDKHYSENAMLGVGRLDYYMSPKSKTYAEFLYTSANGSFFSQFLPITFQSAGDLYLADYSNIMRLAAGYSYNPVNFLNMDIAGKLFLYPKEQIPGEGIFNSTEISGGVTIKTTNDLRFRFSATALFPKDADTEYQTSLKAILDI